MIPRARGYGIIGRVDSVYCDTGHISELVHGFIGQISIGMLVTFDDNYLELMTHKFIVHDHG